MTWNDSRSYPLIYPCTCAFVHCHPIFLSNVCNCLLIRRKKLLNLLLFAYVYIAVACFDSNILGNNLIMKLKLKILKF